jgi:membrane-associated phospholipid phosphatase
MYNFLAMAEELTREEKKIADKAIIITKEMLIALIIFMASLVTFIVIAFRVFALDKTGADSRAFAFAESLVSDRFTAVMNLFTFFGSHYFLIPANIILAVIYLLRKKSRYTLKVAAIALTSLLIMMGLKLLFHRERPLIPLLEPARGLSFPSGHSFMSVCFYGLLMIIIWKEEKYHPVAKWSLLIITILLVFMIGFSRIYLRVHYFTDVLAGFSIGFSWLLISSYLIDQVKPRGLKKAPAA